MITLTEAIEIVENEVTSLSSERVPLRECVGRVLAEDIVADSDLPPFDRSQMDGFAVRSQDCSSVPAVLTVVGESAAGRGWDGEIKKREAVRIMTGARVPAGADAVQQLELTSEAGGQVEILETVKPGLSIVAKGAEVKAGEIVFSTGEFISAQMVAALAAFGYAEVSVGTKPKVGILSTGTEIVAVGDTPGRDQIRNSNSPMLNLLACRHGGEAREYPHVADDLASLKEAIAEAAYKSDILVITGGVSVGKYDLTKDAIREMGGEIFFERVRLKPGKPTVFARLGETLVFGLPGNPVSAAVTFHLLVRRAMLRMQGAAHAALRSGHAVAKGKMKGNGERDTYLPAALETDETGRAVAVPLKWLGSSDFIGFARADALVLIPAGQNYAPGEVVQTFRL